MKASRSGKHRNKRKTTKQKKYPPGIIDFVCWFLNADPMDESRIGPKSVQDFKILGERVSKIPDGRKLFRQEQEEFVRHVDKLLIRRDRQLDCETEAAFLRKVSLHKYGIPAFSPKDISIDYEEVLRDRMMMGQAESDPKFVEADEWVMSEEDGIKVLPTNAQRLGMKAEKAPQLKIFGLDPTDPILEYFDEEKAVSESHLGFLYAKLISWAKAGRPPIGKCGACARYFYRWPQRSDGKFCSNPCRNRAWTHTHRKTYNRKKKLLMRERRKQQKS